MKEREKITMLTTIIIVVAIYFVAMLGIGWYGRRYWQQHFYAFGRPAY